MNDIVYCPHCLGTNMLRTTCYKCDSDLLGNEFEEYMNESLDVIQLLYEKIIDMNEKFADEWDEKFVLDFVNKYVYV